MDVDDQKHGDVGERKQDDCPRMPHGKEQTSIKHKGAPVESEGICPFHQRKTASAELFYQSFGKLRGIVLIECAFKLLELWRSLFLRLCLVDVEPQEDFPRRLLSRGNCCEILAQLLRTIEFAVGFTTNEIEMDVAVIVGKSALRSVNLSANDEEQHKDAQVPVGTF